MDSFGLPLARTAALDRDEFRSNRPEFINAIDSKEIERDAGGKPLHTFPHPALVLGTLAFSAVAGLAFAGWIENAPAMVMALAEQGMAWCF